MSTITKAKTRPFTSCSEPGKFELLEKRHLLRIGILLWILAGISFAWVCVNKANESPIQSQVDRLSKQDLSPGLISHATRKPVWKPRTSASGEFGALQDTNISRVNSQSELQDLLYSAPPGFERGYRIGN